MVLQCDRPLPVWGWADPGDEIAITFAGQTRTARAAPDGAWRITLDRLSVSAEPRVMVIRSKIENRETKIEGILVGEVWLCSGQSNMGLSLRDCFDAPREIAAADFPRFRFFVVPGGGAPVPAPDIGGGKWRVCTPETAADFAGTAYFFGRALHRELKTPVGLIEFDRGSTGIEGWIPLAGCRESPAPALQAMYHEAARWDPRSDIGRQAHTEAFAAIDAWLPAAKAALSAGKPVPPEPLLPAPSRQIPGPTTIFNGILHPLVPFAIRGATWYHGEANPGEGAIYEQKLKAMITGWRAAWGQGDFPFYFVQLANEGNTVIRPMEEESFRYVPVREAQRRALELPHTGMAVAIDLGEDASGHPRNKQDVGERLARWALANTYNRKVPFSGPLYRSFSITGDTVVLRFDHVGSGLMVGDKNGLDPVHAVTNGVLGQFAIAGGDGTWHWADARIAGRTVEVRSDRVPVPVKVRYAYSMNPKGGKLYNREGLPASPFRTDDW
ncbi:MAG: hypothetical protein A2498_13250 [Lentisphaerae bacterium RIFOXYC12_FULL_60_16]|nr:MAG: hypothetical protein A2498_13250 [Lentisphaerae bacterium RIFOXYC12_FULL_60_16]